MEGLASRCHRKPRRPLPRHHHAGADAARLASGRSPAYADVRLRRPRHLGRVDSGGRFLATSGATQLILWPFHAKDGPMGKQPLVLAPFEHRVETVACHPRQDIVAAGYGDGLVLLVRIEDGAEILAKKPGDAPVTALAWSADGLAARLRNRKRRSRRDRSRLKARGTSSDRRPLSVHEKRQILLRHADLCAGLEFGSTCSDITGRRSESLRQ